MIAPKGLQTIKGDIEKQDQGKEDVTINPNEIACKTSNVRTRR